MVNASSKQPDEFSEKRPVFLKMQANHLLMQAALFTP